MAQKQEKIRTVQIIKNDPITGVEYGEVEFDVPVTTVVQPVSKLKIERAQQVFANAQQSRKSKLCNRTKKK